MKKIVLLTSGALILSLICGCSANDTEDNAMATLVTMDVNPSITLRLNKNDKVIQAIAGNTEGEIILDDLNLESEDMNIAVDAIVDNMVQEGYISNDQNTVLLSVDNNDEDEKQRIEESLSNQISEAIAENDIDGAVLSQSMDVDDDVQRIADTYQISVGKAALIEKILDEDQSYMAEALAQLTTQELALIYESVESNKTNTNVSGTISTSAFISKEEALAIALSDAKLRQDQITDLEIDFDYEKGEMTYEIEFKANGYEYDYEIGARSKQIMKGKIDGSVKSTSAAQKNVTSQEALSIVLMDAGLTKDQVTELKVEYDDGDNIYEIEFKANGYEYEYEVNASTKQFVKEVELHESSTAETGKIKSDEALSIALKDAGLTKDKVTDLKVKYEYKDNVYEIEFKANGYKYEYEVNASTKKFVKEVEEVQTASSETAKIKSDEALSIALKDAGLTKDKVKNLKVDYDYEDNVYEVEFKANGYEYEYEINASTKKFVKHVEAD